MVATAILSASDVQPLAFAPAYNLAPSNLPVLRSAISKVLSGDGDAIVALIGDSTEAGCGSNGTTIGLRSKSTTSFLKDRLNAAGIPSQDEAFVGTALGSLDNTVAGFIAYDPRITFPDGTTGWSGYNANRPSIGGNEWQCAATSTNRMAFTPTIATDTFTVRAVGFNGATYDVLKLSDDLGNSVTADTNVAEGIVTLTLTTTRGLRTFYIQRNNTRAGLITVISGEARDSTKKMVRLLNMGWAGAASFDWVNTTNLWNPRNGLKLVAPHATFINLGLNDYKTGIATDAATFQSNIQQLMAAAQVSGDVILQSTTPADPSRGSQSLRDAYKAALFALAGTTIPLIDLEARFGSWAALSAQGLNYDTVHLRAAGYADRARALSKVFMV